MKQTVYLSDFREAFRRADRGNQFSHEGLEALFNALAEYEDASGIELELDVIAICCEYAESYWADIARDYQVDLEGIEDEDKRKQAVADYINDNSYLCAELDNGAFVFQQF